MLKTLVTVSDVNLKKMIFTDEVIEKLYRVSEVDWVEEGTRWDEETLAGKIGDYDACITSWGSPKLTGKVLENAGKLKFVGHGAGTIVPYVDESIFEKDIVVVNANAMLSRSTAEGALALMMAGAWNLHGYNVKMKQGGWSYNNGETVLGLYGQVIGLIGYGDISREVIRLLKPFYARILLCSRYCPTEEAEKLGVELCGLEELLKKSKIISLHNTLTPSTMGMIGKQELDMVQPGALIVNTARAPIIDEQALIEHLKAGKCYAALDVFPQEPMDRNHELLKLPNVLCTPHIAGFSSYWKTKLAKSVIDDLEKWSKGEKLEGQFTKEKFRRLTPG